MWWCTWRKSIIKSRITKKAERSLFPKHSFKKYRKILKLSIKLSQFTFWCFLWVELNRIYVLCVASFSVVENGSKHSYIDRFAYFNYSLSLFLSLSLSLSLTHSHSLTHSLTLSLSPITLSMPNSCWNIIQTLALAPLGHDFILQYLVSGNLNCRVLYLKCFFWLIKNFHNFSK